MELELDRELYRRNQGANKAYLDRISILFNNHQRCIPIHFYDDAGNELKNKIIMISDTQDSSVSMSKKDSKLRVVLDGTNFATSMYVSKDGTRYKYNNEALKLNYDFQEIIHNDGLIERSLEKKIGDMTIQIQYYIKGDYILIAGFLQRNSDESHIIALKNTTIDGMTIAEISKYIDDEISDEIDGEGFDDDTVDMDDIEQEVYPEVSEEDSWECEVDENTETEIPDEVVFKKAERTCKIYNYNFPSAVENFDYDDYVNFLNRLQNIPGEKSEETAFSEQYEVFEEEIECDDDIDNYSVFYKRPVESEEDQDIIQRTNRR